MDTQAQPVYNDGIASDATANHKTIYHDNLFDRLFIALFSRKMAKAVLRCSGG